MKKLIPAASGGPAAAADEGTSRREFLAGGAGAAAGAAMILGAPKVASGGPTFFEFGDDVLYSIYIDNDRDGRPDITYQFTFESQIFNEDTFLYNTGPIGSLEDPNWSKRQFFDVTRSDRKGTNELG